MVTAITTRSVTWAKTGMKAPEHAVQSLQPLLCPSTCPTTLLCLTGNVRFISCCYCWSVAFIIPRTAHYSFQGFNECVIPESERPKGDGVSEAYILSFSQWYLYKRSCHSSLLRIDATEIPGIKECFRRLGSEKWYEYIEDNFWGVCRQCSRRIDKLFLKGGVKKVILVFDEKRNLKTVRVYNGKQYWGDWRK